MSCHLEAEHGLGRNISPRVKQDKGIVDGFCLPRSVRNWPSPEVLDETDPSRLAIPANSRVPFRRVLKRHQLSYSLCPSAGRWCPGLQTRKARWHLPAPLISDKAQWPHATARRARISETGQQKQNLPPVWTRAWHIASPACALATQFFLTLGENITSHMAPLPPALSSAALCLRPSKRVATLSTCDVTNGVWG